MPVTDRTDKTGAVPVIIYGTAWKEDKTEGLVEQALAQGFRAIDTANQRKHYFEEAVGRGIKNALGVLGLSRSDLFLQSKYTFQRGQDHRLPYDPAAPIEQQVAQSFESTLRHLRTDYLDSLVLHGPSVRVGLSEADWAAWRGLESIHASGRVRFLGVSNVNLGQLEALCDGARVAPRFVQNRCYAKTAWDRDIRVFCAANGIAYQGFSLLTANPQVFRHPILQEIARGHRMSIIQTIFRFALDVGMIPLTGTSNTEHMKHDLLVSEFKLSQADVDSIETIALEK